MVAVVEEPFASPIRLYARFYDLDFSFATCISRRQKRKRGSGVLKEWVLDIPDRTAYIQHYIERSAMPSFRNPGEIRLWVSVSYAY